MRKHPRRLMSPAARRLFLEPLESRALLSASGNGMPLTSAPLTAGVAANIGSAAIENGALTVQGTSSNDVILLQQDSRGRVVVLMSGRRLGPFVANEVVVDGQAGNDVLRAIGKFSKPLTMRGGDGNDMLEGGRGSDRLQGDAGNDFLRGAGGSDELDGGEGADVLHGNEGHDTLRGQSGNDQQFGGAGNDLAFGDEGHDLLDGGAGNDILSAGAGNDRLKGQAGRDVLIGGDGADRVEGGGQDDILIAGQTIHDTDPAVLDAVLATWAAKSSYAARVATISGSLAGQQGLDRTTVIDDQDLDNLLGAGGTDWFFAAASDKLVDRGRSEALLLTDNLTLPLVNRPVVAKPGVQQMPSVAVNPLDPNHVVIAYMDYSLPTADVGLPGEGYAGIGVAVSRDGGNTWHYSSISLPTGFDQGADHPIAKFDGQGRVFVSFMAVTFLGPTSPLTNPDFFNNELLFSERTYGYQSNNGIFVARSDDGGATWGVPVAVVSHLYDGQHKVSFEITPDMDVDTFRLLPNGTPNPSYGNLYVVWSRVYVPGEFPGHPEVDGGIDAMLAVSQDGGRSWQLRLEKQNGIDVTVIQDPLNIVGAPGLGCPDNARLDVGPEGDLYVSPGECGNFVVHHSTDAGLSFDGPNPATGRRVVFGTSEDTVVNGPLPTNHFRQLLQSPIIADPVRPGHVYAFGQKTVAGALGDDLDHSELLFGRSTDYGVTWQTTFHIGATPASVLNDDNGGQTATGQRPNEVVSGQVMPLPATDAQGNLSVIWYDTRHDPANHLLDVFGTISFDGGQSFAPNYRVSDQSFDANVGQFSDATGRTNYYLGDVIGFALANNTAFATWTDTRGGTQDIYFTRFSIDPAPSPPNDRFEQNDTAGTATDLSTVIKQSVPRLAVPPGDEDWFRLKAASTGDLKVAVVQTDPSRQLRIELRDASGQSVLASGTDTLNSSGQIIGQELHVPGNSGDTYLVRILATVGGTGSGDYSLQLSSLKADVGTVVHHAAGAAFASGQEHYYLLAAAASGSLELRLTSSANLQGDLKLEVLDAEKLIPLATGTTAGVPGPAVVTASVPVRQGQSILARVFGASGTQGDYGLEVTNLDQFTTSQNASVFVPAGAGPSQAAVGDINRDGSLDVVVSDGLSNNISLLLGNGNGSFQAPRQFAIGAFQAPNPLGAELRLPTFRRSVALADLDRDGNLDVAVTNYDSADVSVLLGRGDGTFQTQRRFDATPAPFDVTIGDVNGNGVPDLIVVSADKTPTATVAVLLGHGNGTFAPQQTFKFPSIGDIPFYSVRVADLNQDAKADIVVSGSGQGKFTIFLGNGNGTFQSGSDTSSIRLGTGLTIADVNVDGRLDIVTAGGLESSGLFVHLGNGDATFTGLANPATGRPEYRASQMPVAVAVADVGSQLTHSDGSVTLGPVDGRPDIIAAASGGTFGKAAIGPPGIFVLPAIVDGQSNFVGFGAPLLLASAEGALDVDVGHFNSDGALDVVAVDREGVLVVYGQPPVTAPNITRQTARDLGTVVHVVEPTLTITPAQTEAWFRFKVPNEADAAAADQIVDISALIEHAEGAGLGVELRNSAGNVVASGARIRERLPQGAEMFLRVFARQDASGQVAAGAYTLVLNVLPQVVSVESQFLLPSDTANVPGGPTTSIVLTLQGDRLDPATAQNKANYSVTWLGPNGSVGGGDQVIPLSAGAQPVVYSPSTNVELLTDTRFPTAVHQTVTLLFDQPLPAGSYQIDILPSVQSEDFNSDEDALLSGGAALSGHPIVQASDPNLAGGVTIVAPNLVQARGTLGDFSAFEKDTPFLSQLHDDLAALLDGTLTLQGDDPNLSQVINDHIRRRVTSALGQVAIPQGLLVVWLDPGSFDLTDPNGDSISYDIGLDEVTTGIDDVFVDVIGNIEILVLLALDGLYEFTVSDLGDQARGGYVLVGADGTKDETFTEGLRSTETEFPIDTSGG